MTTRKRRLEPVRVVLEKTLRDTWAQIQGAQLFTVAASLAYTTILSIIPLLALSFAVFKVFGGMDQVYDKLQPFLLNNLAEGVSDDAISTLAQFINQTQAGTVGLLGFFALVVTSMSMLSSIEQSINRVWGVPNSRPLFLRFATYWMFITLGPLLLALIIGFASTSREIALHWVPGWVGIFLITTAGFFGLYRWVPNTKVYWGYAAIAALAAAILWNVAQAAYVIYVREVVSYDRIYGSLSAVPVLLLWIYIAWIITLAGAALGAALQRRIEGEPLKASKPLKSPAKPAELSH